MNLVEVEHVSKQYSNHKALDDVSLEVPEGTIYGLLGPNGAGKTTLIRIINRITAPDTGIVRLNGHPLQESDIYNIGYLPEERGLYKKMKVGDQAVFFARLKGLSKAEAVQRLRFWFDKFEISDWWNRKVEELSKGMAQKVQFITTVLHEPKLLIFDEPFSGFDPINANMLKEEILGLRDKGATIIFSTHNMASVEEICDNITLINKSHNILSGPVAEIRRRYGKNRYSIGFTGVIESLESAIAEQAIVLPGESLGYANITLNPGVKLREIIPAINDAVEIKSISEDIPSMNEIFIHTVDEYNENHSQN
ncbi:MAG: ATP-binding cassette domain-containing protein [Muribaculaceae bacterium]|nr:ATP-binding cassette domain-containing protein [Muribaculaceae bacterium]